MLFKNIRVYRLTKPFSLTPEELGEQLQSFAFEPCGSQDQSRMGWVPPLGNTGSEYVHTVGGYMMVCARQQEKVLPAAVINEHLIEKVEAINAEEGRSVGRKERQNLKDEILIDLMPRAFTRSSLQFAYISPSENMIVINSASAKRAEALLNYLRESIGSVPVIPLTAKNLPQQSMTAWLKTSGHLDGFELGHECELRDPSDTGAVIRCKHQDLASAEIKSHLDAGMYVSKLGLTWEGGIEFVVDEELGIKRVKFSEIIEEKINQVDAVDAAEKFDVDFSVMTLEVSALLRALVSVFGGLDLSEKSLVLDAA